MFEQSLQQQQPQTLPVQMYSTIEKKDLVPDKATNITEFPFLYNVNMIQKVHQTQAGSPTTTAVASISTDDKTCYRFDVAQPFGYNYALVNQMSLAAAASTATFKCEICGLVFAHLSLLNHHKRIHTDNGNSGASTERTFHSEPIPVASIKVLKAQPAKPQTCNRCGGNVVDCEHETTDEGGKKKVTKFVKCEYCQAGPTPTTNTLTTNGSFSSTSPEPTESPPDLLNIPNKGLQLIKRHGLATVTKCHKCNGSGIIFIGGAKPPPTDKPFRCNVCDGQFSRYSSLWSHKRLHSGDKPFKCDICGLTFARQAYLKNHVRVHSGEKPYKCEICGMQFSQSPHLKNHERIHSGERPYQCEVCEKTFARHSTLWNHRRIHTGEKPYRCNVCGSAFNQATHLKNHAKVHTGEKPHRCDICDVGFSDRFALKRHKLIHEKYGRTTRDAQQQQNSNPQNHPPSQMSEVYKCDVAFPGQQPNTSANSDQQQTNQNVDMYKCDATTSVTFPASSQQTDMYKCDVGTSVSFSQQQSSQANSTASQASQLTDSIVVRVDANNHSYQSVQPNQKSTSSNNHNQQANQMREMFKYDVNSSIAFPGQSSQSQTSTSNTPTIQVSQYSGQTNVQQQTATTSSSSQISQFDSGASTVSYSTVTQNTQSDAQQTSATSEIFGHNSESILGT